MNLIDYHQYSFKILSIILFIYFFYHWSHNPVKKSLLMWSTLVVATPIPNASILLSFPLKVFYDIPFYVSQIVASILSIGFILFLPSLSQPTFLKNILRQEKYWIFPLSILSSILIANIIDDLFISQYNLIIISIAMLFCFIYLLSIKNNNK